MRPAVWGIVLLAAGCASEPAPARPDPVPEQPRAAEAAVWESAVHHVKGRGPVGWTARAVEDGVLAAFGNERGVIEIRALTLDASFMRPDEKLVGTLTGEGWRLASTCRFDAFGASAVRGDFVREDGEAPIASTRLLWERHEGAPPGRKFLFIAMVIAPASDHLAMVAALEKFIAETEFDAKGPSLPPEELVLADGWKVVTLPEERRVEFAGLHVPSPTDALADRSVSVSAWLDVRDEYRARRDRGEKLADEQAFHEAIAHYNIALHFFWSQFGAPDQTREGARVSPRGYLALFGRASAALAANAASVLKLKALRDRRAWDRYERLRRNAAALEALFNVVRSAAITAEARRELEDASSAGVGDYRDLAFALVRDLKPEAVRAAVAAVKEAGAKMNAGDLEGAEEKARDAVAATQGEWPAAHRAVAAILFAQGMAEAAAGSARNAHVRNPVAADLILDYAELLLASGRGDEALKILDENDIRIRDSLWSHDVLSEYLHCAAHLLAGHEAPANASAESLAGLWKGAGEEAAVSWEFGDFEKALKPDAPGRDRILAMHALLAKKSTLDAFRAAWGLETAK